MATATIERRQGRPARVHTDGNIRSVIVNGNVFRFRFSDDGSVRPTGLLTEELRSTEPDDFAYAKALVRGLV